MSTRSIEKEKERVESWEKERADNGENNDNFSIAAGAAGDGAMCGDCRHLSSGFAIGASVIDCPLKNCIHYDAD